MQIRNGLEEFSVCLHSNLSNDNIISAKRPGLKTGMDCRGLVWKRVWKTTFFGLKSGQDLENQAAHPHQEFPGVPPLLLGCILTPYFTLSLYFYWQMFPQILSPICKWEMIFVYRKIPWKLLWANLSIFNPTSKHQVHRIDPGLQTLPNTVQIMLLLHDYRCTFRASGGSRGGARPPYFQTKLSWGPENRQKFFGDCPPPPVL